MANFFPPIIGLGDRKLKIQKNGVDVATFSANEQNYYDGTSDVPIIANIEVPTVNNGTLTIQKNGTNVATFSANQSSNATANIQVVEPDSTIKTNTSGQFNTVTGGLLDSCLIDLDLVQDLHGYDKPWVGGSGKNKFPLSVADIKSANTNGTWSGNVYTFNGVTYTLETDSDGNLVDIIVNGKATPGTSDLYLSASGSTRKTLNNFGLVIGSSYILTGGGTSAVLMYNGQAYNIENTSASPTTFTVDSAIFFPAIRVTFNNTANNEVIRPMTRLSTETDATFEPYTNICGITGHSSVEVGVYGKNLFDGVIESGTIDINGNNAPQANRYRSKNYVPVKPNTTYVFSHNGTELFINVKQYFADKSHNPTNVTTVGNKFTTTSDTYYIRFFADDTINFDTGLQLEKGSTVTAYEPYLGKTYTTSLGQTVYSGSLDAVSGVLRVDRVSETITSVSTIDGSQYYKIPTYTAKANNFTTVSSDKFPTATSTTANGVYMNTGGAIRLNTPDSYASASDMMTAYGGSIQVCYELATPTTIQLTPQQIETLIGENTLTIPLEGQSLTSLTYRDFFAWDDVERGIEPKADKSSIAYEEKGSTASKSGGYAKGEHFLQNGKFCTALAGIAEGATLTLNTNYVEGTIADSLIKQDTFSGTTDSYGNVALTEVSTGRIPIVVIENTPYYASVIKSGSKYYAHLTDANGNARTSASVSGVYYYIL